MPGAADWSALRDTITAWCESGFNLVRASAALHIHRNTVVYRMHKIEQLTGRPLREHRTTMALYLACLADQLGGGGAAHRSGLAHRSSGGRNEGSAGDSSAT
ncbi:helix-turn-helix domain-containing protein [Streptomyces sp. NPDC050997]|uniref:PucR family transcriptional regulator n=1 Tax=Streptomyces sp. NPDC050997 TaxID=3155519 RepID=UPI0034309E6F